MITQQEYQARRQALASALPEGSIAVIPAAEEVLRNGDAHYRFRQDSDFYYLTGFKEPEALLIVIAGHPGESYLFNRPNNPALEQWTGKRLGQENAVLELGIDKAFSIENLSEHLPKLIAGKAAIYYPIGRFLNYQTLILDALCQVKKQLRGGIKAPEVLCDLEPLLSEMRLFKSPMEIKLMRHAAEISVAAHKRAMKACKVANYEYQLEAELLYEFTRLGCRSTAYDSIVGSGANACVLHYTDNNQPLHDGDLVLIDAGGEFENYAADITRTFPVSGRFTEEQRIIYELVLKAQKAGIALIKPGIFWHEIQQTIVRILTIGLCELGILRRKVDELLANEAYKPFYMHNSGHWLGLDVHDAGRYKINGEWRALEAGMVLTVEPGLYIKAGMDRVEQRWWNIGVRIEDDILVTPEGHENLTAALPVEINEIEALMRD